MDTKARRKKQMKTGLLILVNLAVALVILSPILYAILVSFTPASELFTMELQMPSGLTLENYVQALTKVPLLKFVGNSFLVAGSITLAQIVTCSLAAFAFSFLEFRG